MTKWQVASFKQPSDDLVRAANGSVIVAALLQQRGISTPHEVSVFVDPAQFVPSSANELPGVELAASLLEGMHRRGGRVRVFGDYDTDGQTSTAILLSALGALGYDCDHRLVSRGEGRGLSVAAVERAVHDGIDLLITCDTGSTDIKAITRARELGLQLVITDHHDIPKDPPRPDAFVSSRLLHDNHPMAGLSGAGVAYELVRSLFERQGRSDEIGALLDIVAIGLVADMSPLVGDVRHLVHLGVARLRQGGRVGLDAIYRVSRLALEEISEETIGYQLAPRFNALGRLGEPELGVELLLVDDARRAEDIVARMEQVRQERRANTEAAVGRAMSLVESDPTILAHPAIIVESSQWPAGVLGAVSRRLAMHYDRPAIVAWDAGDQFVVSGRSIEGVDLHEAIASQSDLLVRHGGHPQAAGFTVSRENWARAREGIQRFLSDKMVERVAEPVLAVDMELGWESVSLDVARELDVLRPFGQGNEKPVFVARGAEFLRGEDVSRNRTTPHRRLYLMMPGGERVQLTWFNAGVLPDAGQSVDIVFELTQSVYHGDERLNIALLDWHPAEPVGESVEHKARLGPKFVDLRELPRGAACQELGRLGVQGVVWDEGLQDRLPNAVTRYQIPATIPEAGDLVIGFVPADAASAQHVLDRVAPRRIILMPPADSSLQDADTLVKLVLQMVRLALKQQRVLDIERMAARIGTSEGAVLAALRLLQGRGVIELESGGEGMYNVARGDGVSVPPLLRRARKNVIFQIKEIEAFREAWRRATPEALVALMDTASEFRQDQDDLS